MDSQLLGLELEHQGHNGRFSPPLPAVPVWIGDIGWCSSRVVLIEPSVCQGLLDVWSLGRVWLQERAQEVYGRCEEIKGKPQKTALSSALGLAQEVSYYRCAA